MRGGGLWLAILAISLAASAGCEDLPACAGEVFVAIDPLIVAIDTDAAAPGVQTDVRVRTSLAPGGRVALEVLDAAGRSLGTLARAVDSDGGAMFPAVSVPSPQAVLRATASGPCGIGHAEVTADVLADAGCALRLTPSPEANAYYAPFDVLTARTDPDPTAAGYQATVEVITRAGWVAEVLELAAGEHTVGLALAGPDGTAALPVTLFDGMVGLRAVCRGGGAERASRTTTVVVDTTPPTCALVRPTPGAAIIPALDDNHDLSDGIQLVVAARADGPDVDHEPAIVTIGELGASPAALAAADTDAGGQTSAPASLAPATTPATFTVSARLRDHAGNECVALASYQVVYRGCDVAVTAPTAPVTADADGDPTNGAQADVVLAVDPACAGRLARARCGLGAPAALIGADGRAALRVDVPGVPVARFGG